jgi:RNA polymerase sigma-70 factor (ECF subfamily)
LSGATREDVAADLNITPTNVRVRLHRARQALRKALNEFCGRCCKSGFRDCDCKSTDSEPMCDMSHA